MATAETHRQLLVAVAACEDKKGEDTRILELDPADSGLADFFLITSASNDRQVVAIADEIEYRLKKDFGLYATSVEGRRQAEWILLDYTDIVIHVFLAEKRAFYDIERLRKSARPLTGTEVEAELKAALAKKTIAVRKSAPVAKKAFKAVKKAASAKAAPSPKATSRKTEKGDDTMVVKKAAKKVAKKAAKPAPGKAVAKKAAAKPVAKKAAKSAAKPAATKAAKKAPAKAAVKAPKKAAAKPTPKKAAKPAKKAAAPAPAPAPAPVEALSPDPISAPIAPIAPGSSRGAKPPVTKPIQS